MLGGFFLSVFFGFVPMLLLASIIYWLDRYEKEPAVLLGGVFGWGAVVAVLGALVLQIALDQSLEMVTQSKVVEELVGASLFAPLTEEVLKGLAVALVFLFARREFDSILDGIVYAAVTALGFAATEDVLYYYAAYTEGGMSGMLPVVFLRLVIFGWQHAFFTAFTGIGLAAARINHNLLVRIGAPLLGLATAIFTHSLHNALLVFIGGLMGLATAALIFWTGWLIMFAFIVYLIYREKVWLAEYLREEVALQTITQSQYQAASSFFGQTQARFHALAGGRYRSTARFLQLCGELAHKKRQYARMGQEDGNHQRIAALRAELGAAASSLL